jgi:hypothetical protein
MDRFESADNWVQLAVVLMSVQSFRVDQVPSTPLVESMEPIIRMKRVPAAAVEEIL